VASSQAAEDAGTCFELRFVDAKGAEGPQSEVAAEAISILTQAR
jgi:hypothetical protein